ncbi:MAG: hypothetical protein LBF86_03180 [Helicobacteraceae bacterium]|jgi:hypothetical protein|nr:hypothetical protein [Helicobacteraceae bacterium]
MRLINKALSVTGIITLISINAFAFIPDYPRAVVPGEHHKRITQEALNVIYAEYGYGPSGIPYTSAMENAIETISQSNADVDHDGRQNNPVWHCDGEQLTQCSILVRDEVVRGVENIVFGNVTSLAER